MLNAAKEILKKHRGNIQRAQSEYSTWVNNNEELSGGEKAYRYIDKDGYVYQSVSLRAPEPRTDPKFHIPLIHPKTKKPCSVPPNGFSRTPKTLKDMIENDEIITSSNNHSATVNGSLFDSGEGYQNVFTYTVGFMGDREGNLFLLNTSNTGNRWRTGTRR